VNVKGNKMTGYYQVEEDELSDRAETMDLASIVGKQENTGAVHAIERIITLLILVAGMIALLVFAFATVTASRVVYDIFLRASVALVVPALLLCVPLYFNTRN